MVKEHGSTWNSRNSRAIATFCSRRENLIPKQNTLRYTERHMYKQTDRTEIEPHAQMANWVHHKILISNIYYSISVCINLFYQYSFLAQVQTVSMHRDVSASRAQVKIWLEKSTEQI